MSLNKVLLPVIVTYWWGNNTNMCENTKRDYFHQNMNNTMLTYSQMVDLLKQQANKHGFLFDACKINAKHGYQHAISYKASFIEKMLKKWKRPVLYLDCDMRIHKYPRLFTTNDYDFMAFNWNADSRVSKWKPIVFDWNTLETSGGIFYFNYTKNALHLLKHWKDKLHKYPLKADDRLLTMAFAETNAKDWLRYYWIPMEYFYVPQYYYKTIPHQSVVISHPYALTDEDKAQSSCHGKSRVPRGYDKMISPKHHKHVVEINTNKTIIQCIRNRNIHLRKSGIDYMLKSR